MNSELKEQLKQNFINCTKGFHIVNDATINEATWEDINKQIFVASGIAVYSTSEGSHLPGMDIDSSLGKLSNKSAKYSLNKSSFDISSYRLTTVCNGTDCGTIEEITKEINKRKNFDYYSFMLRDESIVDTIQYDWLLIPSNHESLDPTKYTWKPTIGQRGKNKNNQVGWHTDIKNGCKMSITFSMSSQLWIHIENTEEIKKHVIASNIVNKKPTMNYIQLESLVLHNST